MNIKESLGRFGLNQAVNYVYKDPEKNMMKVMEAVDKFAGGQFPGQIKTIKDAIQNPEHPYYPYVRHVLFDVDREVVKTVINNFFFNVNLKGWKVQEELREKYNCNIPWAVLLDPTSACNLHCTGCWAAEYGNKLNLSFEEIDDIIRQGKEGTLIDDEFADDMLRVKNFVPAISLEGFEQATDGRRGDGVYNRVMEALERLHQRKLFYGISACYTSQNYDSITSTDFLNKLIETGVYFIWYFHYMPVGNDADVSLLPTPEQRIEVYRRINEFRDNNSLFMMDFQNDGRYVGGCIAGGRRYLHINANGDVDPCVFIHYSDSNIREKSLLDALRSPLFMAYHDGQPFNDNMYRPCPMLENPDILPDLVAKTGAHSTDLQSPESAEHLCGKCTKYAENWTPHANEMWEKETQR